MTRRHASPLRRSTTALKAAKFTAVDLEHYRLRSIFLPIDTEIAGTATA